MTQIPMASPCRSPASAARPTGLLPYNSTTQLVTFAPAANYTGAAGFTYAITNGNGGTASATVSLTVTTRSHSVQCQQYTWQCDGQ